jgi:hypothetical protein
MAKIVTKLSLLLLSCAVFLHCANGALQPEEKPQAAPGSGTSVAASAIKVTTAANGILGHVLQAEGNRITLLTNTGWIVDLRYDGTVASSSLHYQNAGCTGSVYKASSAVVYGKSLYYDGTNYYKPSSSPNNAVPSPSTPYASWLTGSGCTNVSGTAAAIQLTPATVEETGLPNPITGPIVLQAP